ncbi:MAG TPA: TfoX/Sxy family protein [Usitatibacter sp.]|nr:TfoX/Sxy family protein [Usitatibacter sp.]
MLPIIRVRAASRSPFSDIDMPKRSDFLDHVVERLRLFGPVTTRRMFGGWGIYRDGVFFALTAGDTLYLKTDDECRAEFERHSPGPFTFEKKGERIVTHYYAVPEEALDDAAVMARWARLGYAAALRRAKAPKRPRKRSAAKPRS